MTGHDQSRSLDIDEIVSLAQQVFDGLQDRRLVRSEDNDVRQGVAVLISALMYAATSGTECRKDAPYSELTKVLRNDGSEAWCCNHDPEHCTDDAE